MQIRDIDSIEVVQPERPDAGTRQVGRGRHAKTAGTDDEHLRHPQALVAGLADLGQ